MARITYVKKAQQRYAMVPVIDPATGQPKETVVTRKDGSPKTDKRGRVITRRVTVEDRTKPLPPRTCGYCQKPIEVGTPYKWIAPKSGPYGGHKMYRHADHPDWNVWEYSSSLSARVAQISHEFWQNVSYDSVEDVQDALANTAQEIRDLAEEKREGANNIEEGFGHPTSASDELNDIADQLDSWADDVESADVPEYPEPEDEDCEACDGSGHDESDDTLECTACDGTGKVTPDEPTQEQIDDWQSEVESALSIVDEGPA